MTAWRLRQDTSSSEIPSGTILGEFDADLGLMKDSRMFSAWVNKKSHLDFGNDFFLGDVDVSCVHDAYDFRFRVLDVGNRCP